MVNFLHKTIELMYSNGRHYNEKQLSLFHINIEMKDDL